MDAQPTPRPWLRDTGSGANCDIRAANNRKVALCWGLTTGDPTRKAYLAECRANADLIVRCVNAHDDLVKALRIHHDWCAKHLPGYSEIGADAVAYRATALALAAAEGGTP